MQPVYSWDFETTTDIEDCRVWAWASVNVNDFNDTVVGTSIDSFMTYILRESCSGTFHNLKFDGEFIINWLLRNGYKLCKNDKKLPTKSFYTLITDKGQFYKMIIKGEFARVVIKDSFKVLPFKVEKIAKDFNLPIQKLSINYTEYREVGHKLTEQEEQYVKYDALIMAMAMNIVKAEGLTRLTIGSNAMSNYKGMVGKSFSAWFPMPNNDRFIRKSYKGGFTYVNPKFAGKRLGNGIVLDVNSLYPSVMHNPKNMYPVGDGIYYEGEYQEDKLFPLYVQRIRCCFRLRKNYLPTIQIKNIFSSFVPTEYLASSGGEIVDLTLTCVDLKLFLEHYIVDDIIYIDGYKYQGKTGLFTDYIVYWTEQKIKAKKEGNMSKYQIAKLMLNNLYGKFATNPDGRCKWPELIDGIVHYKIGDKESRDPVYIPVGTFVTAYARDVTIRSAQKVYHRFVYADTDSLHLLGFDVPKELDIDDYRLGAWKLESHFAQAKFLRAKTYMEHEIVKEGDGLKQCKWKITCAGMPSSCYGQVTFDNFEIGATYTGKLVPRHTKGGIVLVDTTFQIKAG